MTTVSWTVWVVEDKKVDDKGCGGGGGYEWVVEVKWCVFGWMVEDKGWKENGWVRGRKRWDVCVTLCIM